MEEMPRMSRSPGAASLANDGVATSGIERVAHEDGDTRLAHWENGGGIDDFSPEVATILSLIVSEFVDGESRRYDSWVGCHESINICPNLQHLSTECCSYDGSGVVRASTSEVGGVPRGDIARNETTNNGDLWQRVHVLLDGCMSGFKNQQFDARPLLRVLMIFCASI